jgi:hypothetical protein
VELKGNSDDKSVVIASARSACLDGAPPFFHGESLLACGPGRPGAPPLLRWRQRLLHERDQPVARRFPVLLLGPVFAAVDEQHAIGRHAAAGQPAQSLLHIGRQRRRPHIESQFDGSRDPVDVLTTGSRSTDEALLEEVIVELNGLGDSKHRFRR